MNDRPTNGDEGDGVQASTAEFHEGASSEGGSIDLNVKTLDHRVFRVNLLASSSVPQLKRKIEVETGVDSDRQRLIFRGKVLKNERDLPSYALEDGHTLHLVIRPLEGDQPPAPATTASEQGPRQRLSQSRATSNVSTTNDEPDPSLLNPTAGSSINRVLMGATITLPEGQHSAPFLQSFLSNVMNTVQGIHEENAATPSTTAETNPTRPAGRSRPGLNTSALERAVRRASSSRSRATRMDNMIRTISQYLDNEELVFPESVTAATALPAANDADTEAFRTLLRSYATLLERFQPRLAHIPVALAQLQARRDDHQNPTVVSFVRAVETLQVFGDLCKLLSLLGRRLFLRTHHAEDFFATPNEPPQQTAPEAPSAPEGDGRLSNLFSFVMNRLAQPEPAAPQPSDAVNIVQAQIPLPSTLLDQLRENLPEGAEPEHFEFEATIPIWQVLPMLQGGTSTAPTPTRPPSPPTAPPESPARPQWDFDALARFLVADVPATELYGLLNGQRASLLAMLRRVGTRLLEGQELPPMAPGSNREWSTRCIDALRDYIERAPRLPLPVFRHNVLSELVERLSPFVPELIHLCIRATTVTTTAAHSSATAFLDTVVDFLGHMARQFVTELRALLVDATTPTEAALERVLSHCGVQGPVATFAVRALLEWLGSSRRRPADASGPEAKRQRRA
ncbi:hypothetical protein ACHHYP_03697 [Achlya hypogyna]|uniref:Ubiquitin-like domain-containing protein n=1 Tax=Achlya hypogyna TaxID=1202772 RepID=A0A1V9Z348_ACHHY|nr:hypothetical protein ACHHYP_03697 [Achlya hypogyna]